MKTRLTVLICSHNRHALLARTLHYLNRCARPESAVVDIVVAANACTDATHAILAAYPRAPAGLAINFEPGTRADGAAPLPIRVLEEPIAGKSRALNRALADVEAELIAFVDDDHRVDPAYLAHVVAAADRHPDATMLCGRIIPDWDGSEPAWARPGARYRIYPLPIPHFEPGSEEVKLGLDGPLPGGGNLVLRRGVFSRIGAFSVDLGPKGHNLAGGEDSEFVYRALLRGEHLHYCPLITQYHYVDVTRLTTAYVVRKAFERSRVATRVRSRHPGHVPRYFYRKLLHHVLRSIISIDTAVRRFHLVRTAATLGEMRGHLEASTPITRDDSPSE